MQVFTAVIIRAVIGAAETASFDTVGETIRTNHYQSVTGSNGSDVDLITELGWVDM